MPGERARQRALGARQRPRHAGELVVYHTAYHPAFESRLPYNVALVQLEEGPRLLTNIVDGHAALTSEAADRPVELEVQWEGDLALARFRLARSRAGA